MIADVLKRQIGRTPAFVLDLDQARRNLLPLEQITQATACSVLYSMKALPLSALLSALIGRVDGFSVSSLFEARLARDVLGDVGGLHLTSPGLRPDEFAELAGLCSHISFNSLSQYRHLNAVSGGYAKGLRVNPKLSFADDERYDPCRVHSKLGVDIELLRNNLPADIDGLHIHTVFGRTDFSPLQAIVSAMEPLFRQRPMKWVNLGGGYLYHDIANLDPLIELIVKLKSDYVGQVYLEPGKALVGNAGYLVTTVLDRFESDGKPVLVLDTSVNHHPKVFEYQFKPRLIEEQPEAGNSAILAGSSCLAGDLFGEYRFAEIPDVGETLIFADVGAYSLIKANRFNGQPLPAVYLWENSRLKVVRSDRYDNYQRQWFV